jgi:hypothetical protein
MQSRREGIKGVRRSTLKVCLVHAPTPQYKYGHTYCQGTSSPYSFMSFLFLVESSLHSFTILLPYSACLTQWLPTCAMYTWTYKWMKIGENLSDLRWYQTNRVQSSIVHEHMTDSTMANNLQGEFDNPRLDKSKTIQRTEKVHLFHHWPDCFCLNCHVWGY